MNEYLPPKFKHRLVHVKQDVSSYSFKELVQNYRSLILMIEIDNNSIVWNETGMVTLQHGYYTVDIV